MPARIHARARLYHQVRTAHLERAAELPPAVILFANKRYDFAEELAATLQLVPARGWRAAWWLLRNRVETLEINEPLMLPAIRSTAIALAGLRLGDLLGRRRTRVVSYAIENLDPTRLPASGLKTKLRRRLEWRLAALVWRRVDRIAYGTAAARDLYASLLPAKPSDSAHLIWALPAPAASASASKKPASVLFLGAFSDRKGFTLLTQAWPAVHAGEPAAALQLIGKGALQPLAEEFAAGEDSVNCTIDPPRDQIRAALAESQVLVLPSQPSPTWREQVGLPIVEGLSFGCTVVTTTETGLAAWLREHGHQVVPAGADSTVLAEAILAALRAPLSDVASTLPSEDGRLAADAWMFAADVPREAVAAPPLTSRRSAQPSAEHVR